MSLVLRYYATRAIVISLICTFFPFLDIPVFWPILVVYFILLFTIMMKRQIKVCSTPIFEDIYPYFSYS